MATGIIFVSSACFTSTMQVTWHKVQFYRQSSQDFPSKTETSSGDDCRRRECWIRIGFEVRSILVLVWRLAMEEFSDIRGGFSKLIVNLCQLTRFVLLKKLTALISNPDYRILLVKVTLNVSSITSLIYIACRKVYYHANLLRVMKGCPFSELRKVLVMQWNRYWGERRMEWRK